MATEIVYQLTNQPNVVIRVADGACIPFADGNRDYEEYKLWVAEGNVPTPVAAPTAEELLAAQQGEALAYLASTDWYFARKAETGEEVPADVLAKRAAARALFN